MIFSNWKFVVAASSAPPEGDNDVGDCTGIFLAKGRSMNQPMPEAFASIVAGLALGYMSLRTRSIWLGAAIHVTVAISMDFASLWRQGRLG